MLSAELTSISAFAELVTAIASDFPGFSLRPGTDFRWSPPTREIFYIPPNSLGLQHGQALWLLLHELGHAILKHAHYRHDTELLQQEVAAWTAALATLGPRYAITIDPAYAEECLDTYRGWLHQRSQCPQCGATGIQLKTNNYSCLNCSYLWRANEARICNLKRFRQQDQNRPGEQQ